MVSKTSCQSIFLLSIQDLKTLIFVRFRIFLLALERIGHTQLSVCCSVPSTFLDSRPWNTSPAPQGAYRSVVGGGRRVNQEAPVRSKSSRGGRNQERLCEKGVLGTSVFNVYPSSPQMCEKELQQQSRLTTPKFPYELNLS